jgi:hypothetical protein
MAESQDRAARLEQLRKQVLGFISSGQDQDNLEKQNILDRKQDRELKKTWAERWFWVMLIQLVLVNGLFVATFFMSGLNEVTLRIFLGATVLEVFGVVGIITRNLFPRKNS